MCSGMGDRTLLLPGFPIRKSSDQCSVGSSPRLIAAPYVLLRLLVPRHPPCALINLATKMLASTVQFSRYGRHHRGVTARAPQGTPFGSRWAGRVGMPARTDANIPRSRSSAPSGLNSVPTRLMNTVSVFLRSRPLYWRDRPHAARTS
jgi:hypothetical protein